MQNLKNLILGIMVIFTLTNCKKECTPIVRYEGIYYCNHCGPDSKWADPENRVGALCNDGTIITDNRLKWNSPSVHWACAGNEGLDKFLCREK